MKNGQTGNARPCFHCLKMMKDIGINKVYYSTGTDDKMVCEYVKNMVSIQVSSVVKNYYNLQNKEKINYFENLIIKFFPKKIKFNNLQFFIEYNFKNVLPDYNFIIKNEEIKFLNKNNDLILSANII